MNQLNYQQMVQQAVKPKFRGKKQIVSRAITRFPDSAEREYVRINRSYQRLLSRTLKENLPAIYKSYREELREDVREDGFIDFARKMRDRIFKMAAKVEKETDTEAITKSVTKVARTTQNNAISEWQRIVKNTLGIDIQEDYYRRERNQVNTLLRIQNLVTDADRQKMPEKEIQKAVQKEMELAQRSAEMLVRNQVTSLHARLMRLYQEDAGVEKYKWRSKGDSRVRDCHKEHDGKIYRWSDPPPDWYDTKSRGRVYTGKYYNPGEAFCCRCIAVPVFELAKLFLPMR